MSAPEGNWPDRQRRITEHCHQRPRVTERIPTSAWVRARLVDRSPYWRNRTVLITAIGILVGQLDTKDKAVIASLADLDPETVDQIAHLVRRVAGVDAQGDACG